MFELHDHPIGFVYDLVDHFGEDLTLNFSRYYYRPASIFDERECFDIPILEVTPDWLKREVNVLRPEWELALNSIVRDKRGRKRHIGMIDFIENPPVEVVAQRVLELLGKRAANSISYYQSGRSLHGYVLALMEPGEWLGFLGRLLLMNRENDRGLVDSRWIGHRLLGGYSALRWSANSQRHAIVPKKISVLELRGMGAR